MPETHIVKMHANFYPEQRYIGIIIKLDIEKDFTKI